MDALAAVSPGYRSAYGPGFWILTRYSDIQRVLQNPSLFSSSAITVLEPAPKHRWIPEMLDPPEHTTWRRLLSPLFTPARANALGDRIRARCAELIDALAPAGGCEFVTEFARRYPTTIFLTILGLPRSHLPQFLEWEQAILHQPELPGRSEHRRDALADVTACLAEHIESRRREPRDDLVSAALAFEIDGRPIATDELLGLLTLLFIAGLDTVTASLGYMFWHLATHSTDRGRITGDPAIIPTAVEELLRGYSVVLPGRKVTADVEIGGCPMRKGDMVLLPLTAANRDPAQFPDGDHVDVRRDSNRHLAFGSGPHRCLGSHLARAELRIALQEWHRRIPDYALGPQPPSEHADQVLGIDHLNLTWPTPAP